MAGVWLEVALNGPWGQKRQPLIPIRVKDIIDEGVACAQEGASIIHVHAYDEESGLQNDDWEIYARIIEGIKRQCNCLIYPTIPLSGSSFAGNHSEIRFNHVHELAQRGLIEMTVLDPGSVNFIREDQIETITDGFIYMNPPEDIQVGFELTKKYNLIPGFAIYEPGFTRLGAALSQASKLKRKPIYRFMFSNEFLWGYPPKQQYLESHLDLLKSYDENAHWMIAGLGVDIQPIIPHALKNYGHIRIGLEDAPWGSTLSNINWTRIAHKMIHQAGRNIATPHEIRKSLCLI